MLKLEVSSLVVILVACSSTVAEQNAVDAGMDLPADAYIQAQPDSMQDGASSGSGGAAPVGTGGFGGCVFRYCNPVQSLEGVADISFDAVSKSSLETCLDDSCARLELAELFTNAPLPAGTVQKTIQLGAPPQEVTIAVDYGPDQQRIAVDIHLLAYLTDGQDFFSVMVLDEAGDYVTGFRKRITYAPSSSGMCGSCEGVIAEEVTACCPVESEPGGPYLGGAQVDEQCPKTYDFECTTNWRIETDDAGCHVWRYEDETPCAPSDAGTD